MFRSAPCPPNEPIQRKALLESGLLQLNDDPDLRRLVIRTKQAFAADWAAIVGVLDGWQYVIVSSGGHLGAHRRSGCLSSFALMEPKKVFYIEDAKADARFRGSIYVASELITFYAGAPILGKGNVPIGVLCITNRYRRSGFGAWNRIRLMRHAAAAAKLTGSKFE